MKVVRRIVHDGREGTAIKRRRTPAKLHTFDCIHVFSKNFAPPFKGFDPRFFVVLGRGLISNVKQLDYFTGTRRGDRL